MLYYNKKDNNLLNKIKKDNNLLNKIRKIIKYV